MKNEIRIPQRLGLLLARDKEWEARVTRLRAQLGDILDRSPTFFPDYTKHGVDHVNEVLRIADRLIAADTLSDPPRESDLLTPKDAAFLICAIMLHDAGMFLDQAGVLRLVRGDRSGELVEELDEDDWGTLWAAYIAKTRRMSEDNKRSQFGRIVEVSEDCVEKEVPDADDRRIIGEFLRQNHGRLAHEIALRGMPGSEDVDLMDHIGLSEEDRDMIGLLARSHCMELRQTEDYLERFNEGPMPHGIPAFYLMAVLRLADYLDAGEARAPEILERLQKIRVPVSEDEWSWNQCIDPSAIHWDPKKHNVRINAHPKKSSEFVLLDKWLRSVQQELDLCWSVLAEQYPDDRYRLSIHRVVSNLYEKAARKQLDRKFLTREVRVTANPEIVKLMIEPLYGDEPTYGVRELLQNAVDACVERKEWETKHGDPNYRGLVDIRIEGNTFTITDNGMGMNEDILLNYYLCAGSSYRSSDAWMEAYAPEGTSQVARTGKFGVGFLAAFLLGDEIEVHTQHRGDKTGYRFRFDQRSMPLDVERKLRTNIHAPKKHDAAGTTITIRLKETAREKLDSAPAWFDWYIFDEPEVRYFMDGEEIVSGSPQLHRPPAKNDGWLELPSEEYESYLWFPGMSIISPSFYCNGIRIYNGSPDTLRGYGLNVSGPDVSIIDNKAYLEVDLARKTVKSFPEEKAIATEVFRWHIARLLLTPWDTEEDRRHNLSLGFTLRRNAYAGRFPFLLSPGGFSLNCASFLPALCLKEYVFLYYEGEDTRNGLLRDWSFLKDTPCSIVAADKRMRFVRYGEEEYYNDPGYFAYCLLLIHRGLLNSRNCGYTVSDFAAAVWLRSDVFGSTRAVVRDRLNLHPSSSSDGLLRGSWREKSSEMPIHPDRFPVDQFPVAVHLNLDLNDDQLREYADTLFTQVLKDTLRAEPGYPQDLWIPYDMEERKKKFKTAFEDLSVYMDHIKNHPIE